MKTSENAPGKPRAPRPSARAAAGGPSKAGGDAKAGAGAGRAVGGRAGGGSAFLLAQLGQYAADRFADRIAELDLIPAQAGILRVIAHDPGRSQQALSKHLGLVPSRMVAFVDDLEERGYVERRVNTRDRRLNALHLTLAGERLMGEIGVLAKTHEAELTEGLTAAQRAALGELLATLAGRLGLTPGVHPGYRGVGRDRSTETATG